VRESLGMKTQRRNESEDSIANLRRDPGSVWHSERFVAQGGRISGTSIPLKVGRT
jgi:hypothetical protein